MDLSRLRIDRGSGPRRAVRRRRVALPLVLVLALALGVYAFRAPLAALLVPGEPEVDVAVATRAGAVPAAASGGAAANGYVVARRRAALSADTPGRIVELNVEEGSVVAEGDVVARLFSGEVEAALRRAEAELAAADTTVRAAAARVAAAEERRTEVEAQVASTEASLTEARSAVALAEKEFERARGLVADGAVTQERFDQAEEGLAQARARAAVAEAVLARARAAVASAGADVEVARAEASQAEAQVAALAAARDQARATLDKTFVRAPFDGVIVLKDAEVGEVVSPNAQGGQSRGSVATMVDPSTLEVQVDLPETSLPSVEPGAPADVFLDALPGERFPGRVDRIWPTANRQKATIELRVVLDAIDPRMRPEMGARVVFLAERERPPADDVETADDALLVPAGAVVRRRGELGVFVLAGGRVEFRPVRVGAERGRRLAIEAGLDEGERVVVAPPDALEDGDEVVERGAEADA